MFLQVYYAKPRQKKYSSLKKDNEKQTNDKIYAFRV